MERPAAARCTGGRRLPRPSCSGGFARSRTGRETAYESFARAVLDVGCVALDRLHQSSAVRIDSWRCLKDDEEMRRERYREELVVTFTQGGAFGLRSVDTAELVDSTSAVLFWPRTPYSTTHPLGCTDHGCSLSFQRSAVEEVLEAFAPRALEALGRDRLLPPAVRPCRPGSRLRQVLLSELCRRGPVHAMAVDELAFELLEELLEGLGPGNDRAPVPVRPETLEAHRRCVERARSELNRRFREPLRLDDLARAAHASPFHLCRLFKAVTGMTIRRYLLRLRLAAGMGEVVAGEQSLSRIAVDLGFFSHSHFTAAFSKEFGLPPKEVRSLARVWDGISP